MISKEEFVSNVVKYGAPIIGTGAVALEVFFGGAIAKAAGFVDPGTSKEPMSRSQIEKKYQTVGLSSEACTTDPNSSECIARWNYCAEDHSRTGCQDGWITNATGQMFPRISGFDFLPDVKCDNFQIAAGSCKDYVEADK